MSNTNNNISFIVQTVGAFQEGSFRQMYDAEPNFLADLPKFGTFLPYLFEWDRIACCDEVVVACLNGQPIGACSISQRGELGDGVAELVGIYVLQAYRGQGIAANLIEKAVERCKQRGFTLPIKILAMNKTMAKAAQKVNSETAQAIEVKNISLF